MPGGLAALLASGQPLGRDKNLTRVEQRSAVGDFTPEAPPWRTPELPVCLRRDGGACREVWAVVRSP